MAIQNAGFQGAVEFGCRHFVWTGAESPGCPNVYLLRWNAHFQPRQILRCPDRPNAVRVGAKALADAGGRNMKAVATRVGVDPPRQFTVDQPHGLVPVTDEKRHHEQDKLRIGIGKKTAAGTLQDARGDHVHHFAFAAQRRRKIVLDPDAAVRAPFELSLEENHRLAAWRLRGLRVTVSEHIAGFRRPATLRQRRQQYHCENPAPASDSDTESSSHPAGEPGCYRKLYCTPIAAVVPNSSYCSARLYLPE